LRSREGENRSEAEEGGEFMTKSIERLNRSEAEEGGEFVVISVEGQSLNAVKE